MTFDDAFNSIFVEEKPFAEQPLTELPSLDNVALEPEIVLELKSA